VAGRFHFRRDKTAFAIVDIKNNYFEENRLIFIITPLTAYFSSTVPIIYYDSKSLLHLVAISALT